MRAYSRTYRLAVGLAARSLREFRVPYSLFIPYAIKSGNLGVCFLGFSTTGEEKDLSRSAELGLLASIFDLVSDGLEYDHSSLGRFHDLVRRTLKKESADVLLCLMEQKKSATLKLDGLERGIGAFRVVLKHLESEYVWSDDNEIARIGVLLQTVDDLLDHRHDMRSGQLNFLRGSSSSKYLKDLLEWDFRSTFFRSRHPDFLFLAILRARKIAMQSNLGLS